MLKPRYTTAEPDMAVLIAEGPPCWFGSVSGRDPAQVASLQA
jgi:hypothetical protein